ncbi:hypothetical protein OS493_013876 [Desmophyllum pertusum]|uniref:Uncharacterized protein n=1 Tax=Desmophyllum pertusum TaxID=174260 RepID=A0A9X0D445_9CNID|nr:hypothetical protein OS493_013876 [Desmophyllum pertusum]
MMKSFLAVSLFVAFVAVVRADGLAELEDDPGKLQVIQCKKDLYNCFKAGNSTKKECLVAYKNCMVAMVPTMPYFVTLCKKDLSWCVSHAQGIKMQAGCFVDFAKCLKNKGPTPVTYAPDSRAMDAPAPTRHTGVQCQIDLYDCNNKGDKTTMECLTDYKTCMAQLIPPYVETCNNKAKVCYANGESIFDKAKCAVDYAECLTNGASEGPDEA